MNQKGAAMKRMKRWKTMKHNIRNYLRRLEMTMRQGSVQSIKRKSVWFNAIPLQMFSAMYKKSPYEHKETVYFSATIAANVHVTHDSRHKNRLPNETREYVMMKLPRCCYTLPDMDKFGMKWFRCASPLFWKRKRQKIRNDVEISPTDKFYFGNI